MRAVYHEKLSELNEQIATLCGVAGAAMKGATESLLQADVAAAEQVMTDQGRISASITDIETQAVSLLSLQQPVAGELRSIVATVQIAADVDRMGALAAHVAKIVRRRHPEHVLPDEVTGLFTDMGRVACELGASAQQALASGDAEKAARLQEDDDEMDDLHRQLFMVLMDHGGWTHGVRAAVDVALLSRFYERFADHAVEIGRRVVFQATGALPAEQEIGTY
ncbi:phosphate signaling complex protein PhoU [Mycolicibacterium palauense]|uniref:phosphate signaling complex protein PhoU n=1 Tax=Mycolicibacterium palauense TaxID=2034511 RepID=UPI000BFEC5A9|nr:phosphate signaling complex protein PhoU [Mycolicibacterium palauense]